MKNSNLKIKLFFYLSNFKLNNKHAQFWCGVFSRPPVHVCHPTDQVQLDNSARSNSWSGRSICSIDKGFISKSVLLLTTQDKCFRFIFQSSFNNVKIVIQNERSRIRAFSEARLTLIGHYNIDNIVRFCPKLMTKLEFQIC